MARRILPVESNPGNPTFFGEDLTPLAIEAVGLTLTAFTNDKVAAPLYQQIFTNQGSVVGKAADAAGTGLSAWLTGEVVGLLFGSRFGRLIRRGGMLLGVGKGISIVLPGFSITGSLPSSFSLAFPQKAAAPAQSVAPSTLPASIAVTTVPALVKINGSMGL
jgi:hypothetical protein